MSREVEDGFGCNGLVPTAEERRAEREMESRLKHARDAATYKAWIDLFARFSDQQRQHMATLMAHHWHIESVTLRNTTEGRDYTHVITGERKC